MNWKERIENIKLEIITGDKKSYFPEWKDAQKEIEFNVGIYNFVNVDGSYVPRKEQKGRKFDFTLYFQGEDNIEMTNNFLESAKNKGVWKIIHPLYDNIFVQPTSIMVNDTDFNVTTLNVSTIETIIVENTVEDIDIGKEIEKIKENTQQISKENFNDIVIDAATSQSASNGFKLIDLDFQKIAFDDEDLATYTNIKKSIEVYSSDLGNFLQKYTDKMIELTNLPTKIKNYSIVRFKPFIRAFENILEFYANYSSNSQKIFEFLGANLLSSACQIASLNKYNTRKEISQATDEINNAFQKYRNYFDNYADYLQSDKLSSQIDLLVNYTISNLLNLTFDAKQERIIYLQADDNIFNLTNKYFDFSDENLQKFIDINELSVDEFLILKKGRQIKYYV